MAWAPADFRHVVELVGYPSFLSSAVQGGVEFVRAATVPIEPVSGVLRLGFGLRDAGIYPPSVTDRGGRDERSRR